MIYAQTLIDTNHYQEERLSTKKKGIVVLNSSQELVRQVYVKMKLIAKDTKTCIVSFGYLADSFGISLRQAIECVNWLEKRNIVEFVNCDRWLGGGDYENVYTIWEWRG